MRISEIITYLVKTVANSGDKKVKLFQVRISCFEIDGRCCPKEEITIEYEDEFNEN